MTNDANHALLDAHGDRDLALVRALRSDVEVDERALARVRTRLHRSRTRTPGWQRARGPLLLVGAVAATAAVAGTAIVVLGDRTPARGGVDPAGSPEAATAAPEPDQTAREPVPMHRQVPFFEVPDPTVRGELQVGPGQWLRATETCGQWFDGPEPTQSLQVRWSSPGSPAPSYLLENGRWDRFGPRSEPLWSQRKPSESSVREWLTAGTGELTGLAAIGEKVGDVLSSATAPQELQRQTWLVAGNLPGFTERAENSQFRTLTWQTEDGLTEQYVFDTRSDLVAANRSWRGGDTVPTSLEERLPENRGTARLCTRSYRVVDRLPAGAPTAEGQ